MTMRILGFEAIIAPDARVLVLGTMPGEESMRVGEYYANRRNSFWSIMSELFGFPSDASYRERIEGLKARGVALWDVLHACERDGSLDSKIRMRTAEPNDFQTLLTEHPKMQRICFNGRKASDLFERLVLPRLSQIGDVSNLLVLPSTSPANTQLSYEQKAAQWTKIKEVQ